jgi:Protein of unknown function (DUF2785)
MIPRLLLLLSFGLGAVAWAAPNHDRQFWKDIARQHYAVPDGESASALAHELSGLLASPDPELRDDLAYSILTSWTRTGKLSNEDLISLSDEWRANLKKNIGESGNDTVLQRSFSALCLSEIGARDVKSPFLGTERYHALLSDALNYLTQERDLRGYEVRVGWIHATAHTADLLEALAENPALTVPEQERVLNAISERFETANVIYTHGEQDRLALAVLAIIERADFQKESFARWLQQIEQKDSAMWKLSPIPLNEMSRYQNDTYMLESLAARVAVRNASAGAGNSPTVQAYKSVLQAVQQR